MFATEEQQKQIDDLRDGLDWSGDQLQTLIKALYGVSRAGDLRLAQAEWLILGMEHLLNEQRVSLA